jgi:hypothetical protein
MPLPGYGGGIVYNGDETGREGEGWMRKREREGRGMGEGKERERRGKGEREGRKERDGNGACNIFLDMGRLPESEKYLLEAIRQREILVGSNHPDVAMSLANLGGLYLDWSKYKQAELPYTKALQVPPFPSFSFPPLPPPSSTFLTFSCSSPYVQFRSFLWLLMLTKKKDLPKSFRSKTSLRGQGPKFFGRSLPGTRPIRQGTLRIFFYLIFFRAFLDRD